MQQGQRGPGAHTRRRPVGQALLSFPLYLGKLRHRELVSWPKDRQPRGQSRIDPVQPTLTYRAPSTKEQVGRNPAASRWQVQARVTVMTCASLGELLISFLKPQFSHL